MCTNRVAVVNILFMHIEQVPIMVGRFIEIKSSRTQKQAMEKVEGVLQDASGSVPIDFLGTHAEAVRACLKNGPTFLLVVGAFCKKKPNMEMKLNVNRL